MGGRHEGGHDEVVVGGLESAVDDKGAIEV